MSSPLFSLILPTKNRAHLAEKVILHLKKQTFKDFEIVVSDNDDSDETFQKISQLNLPNICYVRTGGLNMPENWQRGFDAASGKYLVMIEDKLFLAPNFLEILGNAFDKTNLPVGVFGVGSCSASEDTPSVPVDKPRISILQTETAVKLALRGRVDHYQKIAPRGLNTAIIRHYGLKIQEQIGPLFRPISPDYTFGSSMLLGTKSYFSLSSNISFALLNAPSNGAVVAQKAKGANAYFEELGLTDNEIFSKVPIRAHLLSNYILNDLLEIWKELPDNVLPSHFEKPGYYLMLLSDILIAYEKRNSFSKDLDLIRAHWKKESSVFKLQFLKTAISEYYEGWPNRKLRMRENWGQFYLAIKLLFGS